MLDFKAGFSRDSSLQKQLDALKKKATRKQLQKALMAGGKVIERAMKDAAPVRTDSVSGDALPLGALKAGIAAVPSDDDAGKPVVLVGPSEDTAHVAGWVEFGHRMVTGGYNKVKPGGKTRGPGNVKAKNVPPHPFLRPAFESSQQASMEAIIDSLKQDVA